MDLMRAVLQHAASYPPEYKTTMSDFIEKNANDDGIDRRGFLKCMAWAGTGDAREARRRNLRGISPPKSERVRKTRIPTTSLLTRPIPGSHERLNLQSSPGGCRRWPGSRRPHPSWPAANRVPSTRERTFAKAVSRAVEISSPKDEKPLRREPEGRRLLSFRKTVCAHLGCPGMASCQSAFPKA